VGHAITLRDTLEAQLVEDYAGATLAYSLTGGGGTPAYSLSGVRGAREGETPQQCCQACPQLSKVPSVGPPCCCFPCLYPTGGAVWLGAIQRCLVFLCALVGCRDPGRLHLLGDLWRPLAQTCAGNPH